MFQQQERFGLIVRPYRYTEFFAFLDFALGLSWISMLLALMFMIGKIAAKAWDRELLICCFCFLQVLILMVLALTPAENARLWIFLVPLILLPAGLELCSFSFRSRLSVYFFIWALTAVICQNMLFIAP